MKEKSVLFIATSHDRMGKLNRKTGLWLEEFAVPYVTLAKAGFKITTASPKGGEIPLDPESLKPENIGKTGKEFLAQFHSVLEQSIPLNSVSASDFCAVFYPGGHGPLWDLAENPQNAALLEEFYAEGKVIGAVCHGPAALLSAYRKDGKSILADRHVTGFSNDEEKIVALEQAVPFSLEDRLKASGCIYTSLSPWSVHVVTDGLLVTGQNPQSSGAVAEKILQLMQK